MVSAGPEARNELLRCGADRFVAAVADCKEIGLRFWGNTLPPDEVGAEATNDELIALAREVHAILAQMGEANATPDPSLVAVAESLKALGGKAI